MMGVGLLVFCCIMFIHLGMGDTFIKIIHYDFILFRCVKCLTFWTTLTYTLFVLRMHILESVSLSFGMSYISLWVDLILAKIAERYDYWYEQTNKENFPESEGTEHRERGTECQESSEQGEQTA